MTRKRIKIKSKLSKWELILICAALAAIVIAIICLVFICDYAGARSKYRVFDAAWVIIFFLPLIFSDATSKKEYLSDIYISEFEIELVYKIQNEITKTKIIDKNNIKSFELNADIDVIGTGKSSRVNVFYKFFIDLIKDPDIHAMDTADTALIESNYNFIYKIIDASKDIPNFKLNVKSSSETIKAEIDYYKRFGRKIPFWTKSKLAFKKCPIAAKIAYGFSIICMFLCLFLVMLPMMPNFMNQNEKQYITLLERSTAYEENPDQVITYLDSARNLIATDPYLYYCYAKTYKNKKDYPSAIQYITIGISNLGNKEIFSKKYWMMNLINKSNTDVKLYQLLGDCHKELQEYNDAIEAYNYGANSKNKYEYTDVYFSRGLAYFELRKYQEAKMDFMKHKNIVEKYIETHSEYEWANTYSKKDIVITNKWIKACDLTENNF